MRIVLRHELFMNGNPAKKISKLIDRINSLITKMEG